jgi:PAS domain S-box-containing protein
MTFSMHPLLFQTSRYAFNVASLPPLAAALAGLFLGIIVFSRGKNRPSFLFLLLSASLSIWFLAFALMYSSSQADTALAWARLAYLGVPFIPALSYHIALESFGGPRRRHKVVLSAVWLLSGFSSLVALRRDWLIAGLYSYRWGYYPRYGWYSIPFMLIFVGIAVGTYLHYREQRRHILITSPRYRKLRTTMAAYMVVLAGMLDFLPKFGIPLYPVGYLPFFIFLFLLSKHVWQHGLIPITPAFAAESIINTMADALLLFDAEGFIQLVNPAFCALFDLPARRAQGKPLLNFLATTEGFSELATRLAEGKLQNVEFSCRLKNGERTLSISSAVMYDNSPLPVATLLIFHDLTERKQLKEQLEHSQKLESIGRLAGGMAHDFNNLMTTILGYSDLLLEKPDIDTECREHILEIKKAVGRANGLTGQLLTFSRKQIHKPAVVDINLLIKNMEKLLRPLLNETISLIFSLDPAAGCIKADPGQIEQVVMNLAVNAKDAMPAGGRLLLETRRREAQEGDCVLLVVSDTGEGIKKETIGKIFEPFFTTKMKGTGLGLATVYGIVKQSGGSISVDSVPGEGSRFTVSFPHVAEAPSAIPASEPHAPVTPGRETVLVVEDEPALAQVMQRFLRRNGYRILLANQGKEAIERFESCDHVDLLVSDVVMPGMSGLELSEKLRRINPRLKVLYISGYTDDSSVRAQIREGHVAFLPKPFTPDALCRKVREVLDR